MFKMSLKRCIGVGQGDGALGGGKGVFPKPGPPHLSLSSGQWSQPVCRSCSGFCSPNINGGCDLEEKKGRGGEEKVGDDGFIKKMGIE